MYNLSGLSRVMTSSPFHGLFQYDAGREPVTEMQGWFCVCWNILDYYEAHGNQI